MAPKDLSELDYMLEFAIDCTGPVSIRYPRGGVITQKDDIISQLANNGRTRSTGQKIKLGESELLRTGKDIAILAIGDMVIPALEAAQILSEAKIQAEVVNMRFIKPIDVDVILKIAARIKRFIIAEDNILQGGFGSAVLEVLADNNIDATVKRIGIPDKFIAHGKRKQLLGDLGLTAKDIAEAAKNILINVK
jgi:1-deoxy-D-xylulose-5-phosphate synthase